MVLELVGAMSVLSTVQSIYGVLQVLYAAAQWCWMQITSNKGEEVQSFINMCQEVERTLRHNEGALRQAVESGQYVNGDTFSRLTQLLGNLQEASNLLQVLADRSTLRHMMPGSDKITKLRRIKEDMHLNITMLTFHYALGPQRRQEPQFMPPQRRQVPQLMPQQSRQVPQLMPQLDLGPMYSHAPFGFIPMYPRPPFYNNYF